MRTDRDPGPSLAPHSQRPPAFSDRMMWVAIRAHLLAIDTAIDTVGIKTPLLIALRAALRGIAKAIELRWDIKKRQTN